MININRYFTITGMDLALVKRDCVSTLRPALFNAAILVEMSPICSSWDTNSLCSTCLYQQGAAQLGVNDTHPPQTDAVVVTALLI